MSEKKITFMAVHAHPDDEVFSTGGTYARLAKEGVHTVLVTCTLGERGEIVDPEMDEETKQKTFPILGEVREKELRAAVEALGIAELHLLGFKDSGMAGLPENNDPACFHQANFDEAVRRLVKLIREVKPQVLACYEPFGGYGHPDHLQAHRVSIVAWEAAGNSQLYTELGLEPWQPAKLYYTALPRSFFQKNIQIAKERGIDGPWNNPQMETEKWGIPDELITTRYDVREFVENKMQAFRAHRTQISPDHFTFLLPDDMRGEVIGYEHFILARHTLGDYKAKQGEVLEQNLFAGLV